LSATVLTPGIIENRKEIPQCPYVVMQMKQKNQDQRRRLNFVLRMLDANKFQVRLFKGVNGSDYFVTLTLSEEELVQEAVACGYLLKIQ